MNAVVDIGNTSAKIGYFNGTELTGVHRDININEIGERLQSARASRVLVSSVVDFNSSALHSLGRGLDHFLILDHETSVPINNLYGTPKTLGMDRLAAAVGVSKLFQGKNCLTIDAGTCITYDFTNEKSEYIGGAISPGLSMKMKALNTFTANLPLVDIGDDAELIGGNTEDSIKSGVVLGTVSEMDDMIARFKTKHSDLHVILCGGFANFFETKLKHTIFAVPELVLIGLNRILIHNVE